MKRITLLVFSVAAVFLANNAYASDAYLYFMVKGAEFKSGEKANFDYATVRFENSDSYLSLYNTSGTAAGTKVASDGQNSTEMADLGFGYYAGFTGDASALTFLVELWSSSNDGTLVAYQTYVGAEILGHIFGSANAGGSTPLTVTTVVPEPSCALLLLLGISAIALRRREAPAI